MSLDRHWIYLNDDVMFGTPIWPDDFKTQGSGQKVNRLFVCFLLCFISFSFFSFEGALMAIRDPSWSLKSTKETIK